MRIVSFLGGVLIGAVLSGPALAQGAQIAFSGMAHDNSLPVEVTADSLSLDQAAATAVFKGAVVVSQGTLRLGADEIEVIYGAVGDNPTGNVRDIRAVGSVVLTNGAEAAEAARAHYDVAAGIVTMEGDVLLTQGANAITGQTLHIDLASGMATMEGRVKTIIVPATNP